MFSYSPVSGLKHVHQFNANDYCSQEVKIATEKDVKWDII